jgi:hydroxymethylpyrimidine/phosphomethylpyrimidine kinase
MRVVLDDIGADVIKIGMLGSAEITDAVADFLETIPDMPVVLDPVMVSTSGSALLDHPGMLAMKQRLLPRAAIVTPNLHEAEALTGRRVVTLADMETVAADLLAAGAGGVLIKGGHLEGDELVDLLMASGVRAEFRHPRIDTRHTHGTGCTLASAIAAGLAQGLSLPQAVEIGCAYTQAAIRSAPGLGTGHGPLGIGKA